jgi:hypothetical protein
MADSNIQASGCLVRFGIMDQHSLQSIIKTDQPVLAVVLLRLLYWFGIDPIGWDFGGNAAVPVLNILEYPIVNGSCGEHSETIQYGGEGGKD